SHEAHSLGQIKSPFSAPLIHVGEQEGRIYLVTPFVEGATLTERLKMGRLPLPDVIQLGVCLFTALREIHAQGILHRDLKPSNIVVEGTEPLKKATLIDFGLSSSHYLLSS